MALRAQMWGMGGTHEEYKGNALRQHTTADAIITVTVSVAILAHLACPPLQWLIQHGLELACPPLQFLGQQSHFGSSYRTLSKYFELSVLLLLSRMLSTLDRLAFRFVFFTQLPFFLLRYYYSFGVVKEGLHIPTYSRLVGATGVHSQVF